MTGLASLSATAPTDINGYVIPVAQQRRHVRYMISASHTPRAIVNTTTGDVTTPTWVAVAVSGYAPPTAAALVLRVGATGASNIAIAAPNNSYGAYNAYPNASPPHPPLV